MDVPVVFEGVLVEDDDAAEDDTAEDDAATEDDASLASLEDAAADDAEPPVTPWDASPAAALSVAMFFVSFVCSSVILLSMLDVSSPLALACAKQLDSVAGSM